MHSGKVKNKFVELRSQGLSYDKISKQLNISKPTLISWSKEFEFEISNLKVIEFDSLIHQYSLSKESKIKTLALQLIRAEEELAKRDLSDIPTLKLFELQNNILDKINSIKMELRFKEKSDTPFDLSSMIGNNEWEAI